MPQLRPTAPNLREHILDTAVALLRQHGTKKLAQPQVARAAGIRQGHLTYYFPRRSDLLIAVARRSVEMLARELQHFFAGAGFPGADAPTRARVLALVSFVVKDRDRTRLLLALLIEAQDDPELHELMLANVDQVRRLAAAGMGRRADDPALDIALATLWGLAVQHLLFAGQRPDDYTDTLLAQLPDWMAARDAHTRETA